LGFPLRFGVGGFFGGQLLGDFLPPPLGIPLPANAGVLFDYFWRIFMVEIIGDIAIVILTLVF
jgi:hypothetical protein